VSYIISSSSTLSLILRFRPIISGETIIFTKSDFDLQINHHMENDCKLMHLLICKIREKKSLNIWCIKVFKYAAIWTLSSCYYQIYSSYQEIMFAWFFKGNNMFLMDMIRQCIMEWYYQA
jgi:hypothetical protein